MTKKFISKIVVLTVFISAFGVVSFANAAVDSASTSTDVNNVVPVITATPSDGGSHSGAGTGSTDGNPTDVGDLVTFTATAFDVNTDQYYLAVCKSDAIVVGDNTYPTCTGGHWHDDGLFTAVASTSEATETYTTLVGDSESNDWYAFICDKVSGSGGCYPTTGTGDQGSATGTVTFADVPADGDTITIDSIVYEFDTANNGTTGGSEVEVDTSASEDGAEAAAALVAAEAGTSSSMTSRGAIVYVFADTAGAAGNSLVMLISCANCSLSGSTLTGGDLENASPFHVNHAPSFTTVTINDGSDTIEPDETITFAVAVADADTNVADDTVTAYFCSGESDQGGVTSAFNYATNTCTGGTLLCSNTATLSSGTGIATCTDTQNIVSVPTAHATDYTVMVYVEDNHSEPASSGTTSNDFTVTDVAPVLGTYTAIDVPAPSAGGTDTVDFSLTLTDDNGDGDLTEVVGRFFYESGGVDSNDTPADNDCSADENNCYIAATTTAQAGTTPVADSCYIDTNTVSSGTGKTATGSEYTATAICQVTVFFNASDGSWDAAADATDGTNPSDFADAGVTLTMPALQGIDIREASIAYSTVSIGGTSAEQTANMGSVGNIVIDVLLDGTDMTGDGTIAAAQQKFKVSTFDWDTGGAFALLNTAVGGTEVNGCLDVDIPVREAAYNLCDDGSTACTVPDEASDCTATTLKTCINHSSDGDTPLYWKIRIPATQAAGSYTGSNTFTSTNDLGTTCAD